LFRFLVSRRRCRRAPCVQCAAPVNRAAFLRPVPLGHGRCHDWTGTRHRLQRQSFRRGARHVRAAPGIQWPRAFF